MLQEFCFILGAQKSSIITSSRSSALAAANASTNISSCGSSSLNCKFTFREYGFEKNHYRRYLFIIDIDLK